MDRLFQSTFRVAKTVRSETKVGENAVSVAFAAVNLAKQIFSELPQSRVLLVGAGDTAELVAQHLTEHGVKKPMLANRTITRAPAAAEKFNGKAHTLADLLE